ncbi:MAG: hypothetical protein ABI629_21745 [bacterium]
MRRMLLGILVLLLAACTAHEEKKLTREDIAGAVVLESTTMQMGWDYQLRGMYIDGDGKVWAYEQHGTPWYPEKLKPGELSERDMLAKHKGARQIGEVDPRVLIDMAQMISAAAKGPIVRATGIGEAESSGTLEVAYHLDRTYKTYTEIILAGSGDKGATNNSESAKLLLDYLHQVQSLVGYR